MIVCIDLIFSSPPSSFNTWPTASSELLRVSRAWPTYRKATFYFWSLQRNLLVPVAKKYKRVTGEKPTLSQLQYNNASKDVDTLRIIFRALKFSRENCYNNTVHCVALAFTLAQCIILHCNTVVVHSSSQQYRNSGLQDRGSYLQYTPVHPSTPQ